MVRGNSGREHGALYFFHLSGFQAVAAHHQQTIQEAYGKIVGPLNAIDISEILEKSLNDIVPRSGSRWGAFYRAGENSNLLKLTKSVWTEKPAADRDRHGQIIIDGHRLILLIAS